MQNYDLSYSIAIAREFQSIMDHLRTVLGRLGYGQYSPSHAFILSQCTARKMSSLEIKAVGLPYSLNLTHFRNCSEKLGLARREDGTRDRRKRIIVLTARGAALAEELRRELALFKPSSGIVKACAQPA